MREPRRPPDRKTAVACVIAVVCAMPGGLATPSRARAATAGETARARAKLQEGARALDQADYERAMARFQEAFAIVPSPKIFFDFGLAHEGLAHHAEAVDAFERFLADAKDASAETRLQAENYVSTLRPRVGAVTVSCATSGAEVEIDGRALGTTPLGRAFHVAAGPHKLVVQRAGLAPFVREFSVAAGAEVELVADLAPPERTLPLAMVPPPAPSPPALVQTTGSPSAGEPPAGRRRPLLVALVATAVVVVAVSVTLALVLGGSTTYPGTDHTISGN